MPNYCFASYSQKNEPFLPHTQKKKKKIQKAVITLMPAVIFCDMKLLLKQSLTVLCSRIVTWRLLHQRVRLSLCPCPYSAHYCHLSPVLITHNPIIIFRIGSLPARCFNMLLSFLSPSVCCPSCNWGADSGVGGAGEGREERVASSQ